MIQVGMRNIRHIKEENAVLVPLKDWEKLQKELVSLRKRAEKEGVLKDLSQALANIKADLGRPARRRTKRKTADEFLSEMHNAK